MRKVLDYYRDLWVQKTDREAYQGRLRGQYRLGLLNRVLDPNKYSRHTAARDLVRTASGKLLDIGCWGGDSLVNMGILGQFEEVYGVDIIDESIEKARSLGVKAERCNLNQEGLPFPDNTFDVVTCLAVLGQVFDPFHVLHEIHRVLKPGGLLVLNVPNVASLKNRLRILCGRLPITSSDPGWDGGQLHYFTLHDTKKALENIGFQIQEVRAGGAFHRIRQFQPSLLSGTLTFKAMKHESPSHT